MQIYYGHTRIVIQIGFLVFKFPYVPELKKDCNSIMRHLVRLDFGKVAKKSKSIAIRFLIGILANLTEYLASIYFDLPILPKVYFSIGLMSVQKYIDGNKPDFKFLETRFDKLSERARKRKELSCAHYFTPDNFRQIGNNIYMIDSGDLYFTGKLTLNSFFMSSDPEFSKVLCPDILE